MKHASSSAEMQQIRQALALSSLALGLFVEQLESNRRTLSASASASWGWLWGVCVMASEVPTGLVCVYNDVTENRYGDVERLLNGPFVCICCFASN